MRRFSSPVPLTALVLLGALIFAVLFVFLPKIPQPQSYHAFSDRSPMFGIPNWNNVWSSLVFIPLGIWGWGVAHHLMDRKIRLLWRIFFTTVIAIGIGSAIYHLRPNDMLLAIDRLPIAVALMTFLCILIGEERGAKWGICLLPFLIGVGIFSVVWWIYGESRGAGDLRFYIGLQLLAFLTAFLFTFFRTGTRKWLLLGAASFFALSKVFEYYDGQIFAMLSGTVGGHPIKHLLTAIAVVCLILYCRLARNSCCP